MEEKKVEIVRTEGQDSFEFGASGKRIKIYFNNMQELGDKLAKLKVLLKEHKEFIEEMNKK